jgi:hypothetical protein
LSAAERLWPCGGVGNIGGWHQSLASGINLNGVAKRMAAV